MREYVRTLSAEEREQYKLSTLTSTRSKTEVMDKLIAAQEAMKKDSLNFCLDFIKYITNKNGQAYNA